MQKREVVHLIPKRQQIGIMGTAGLAALAGGIRRHRIVPGAHVHDLAIARAAHLVKVSPSKCLLFTV